MLDLFQLRFDLNQLSDCLPAAEERLAVPGVAKCLGTWPVQWEDGATTTIYKLREPPYTKLRIRCPGYVEIEGSVARASEAVSPPREASFPHVTRSNAAQASMILDDAILRHAIGSLVRSVVPGIATEVLLDGIVRRADIPVNLDYPQAPLVSLLYSCAASSPRWIARTYAHGARRNLEIKGHGLEFVIYDKAAELGLAGHGVTRMELRIKGPSLVSHTLAPSRISRGSRDIRVRELNVRMLYRAHASFVHDLAGDRRSVAAVANTRLPVRPVLELIVADMIRQDARIDGMTLTEFIARRATVRGGNLLLATLATRSRTDVDLDCILPRIHWNPRYMVPDVLAHLSANAPAGRVGPQRSEGREVVEGNPCRARGELTSAAPHGAVDGSSPVGGRRACRAPHPGNP